jgi:hypothetical protein
MRRLASIVAATAVLFLATAVQAQVGPQSTLPENPYAPPSCVPGVPFADIQCTTGYDAWIEQFGSDAISAGCGGGNYCPGDVVTRQQMAVFIEKAMHGTGGWTPGDLGNHDTGVGADSLFPGPIGSDNTGVGYASLYNTTGNTNSALGSHSLFKDTMGGGNTGIGDDSLFSNTIGNGNTGVGEISLYNNTTGSGNTAVGYSADVASQDLTNATAIGANALVDASNHVRIGDTNVTQIGGEVGWSALSDLRAKTDIQDLDLGLDFVMALRPVSFQLKQGNGRTDMGFIAQDVEALIGDDYNVLGIGADKDHTLSLRYTDFIAPLVKAVQEQQVTIAAQQAKIDAQQKEMEAFETRLAALEARNARAAH